MPANISVETILLAIIGVIVVLLLAWWLGVRRRARQQVDAPSYEERFEGLKPESGERMASAASEQIEFMVRQRLAGHPDLAETAIDFGSQEDGSLAIWVAGQKYSDPASIPDERIREAVQAAVEEFNQ